MIVFLSNVRETVSRLHQIADSLESLGGLISIPQLAKLAEIEKDLPTLARWANNVILLDPCNGIHVNKSDCPIDLWVIASGDLLTSM